MQITADAYTITDAAGHVHYLHQRVTIFRDGRRGMSVYFSRQLNSSNAVATLPAGYRVVFSPITGRPYARRA